MNQSEAQEFHDSRVGERRLADRRAGEPLSHYAENARDASKLRAFDAIHELLNGTEWDGQTIERVAELVTSVPGVEILEPGEGEHG